MYTYISFVLTILLCVPNIVCTVLLHQLMCVPSYYLHPSSTYLPSTSTQRTSYLCHHRHDLPIPLLNINRSFTCTLTYGALPDLWTDDQYTAFSCARDHFADCAFPLFELFPVHYSDGDNSWTLKNFWDWGPSIRCHHRFGQDERRLDPDTGVVQNHWRSRWFV